MGRVLFRLRHCQRFSSHQTAVDLRNIVLTLELSAKYFTFCRVILIFIIFSITWIEYEVYVSISEP